MKNHNFCILGGDFRQLVLADLLKKNGHCITTFGFDRALSNESKWHLPCNLMDYSHVITKLSFEESCGEAEYIVLPLPCCVNSDLNMPFSVYTMTFSQLYSALKPGQIIIGGIIPADTEPDENVKIYDYTTRDDFAILNAVPSAEGAIQVAMENTSSTLHGSNCLILGFGRIGKLIAKFLYSIGSNVTVVARGKSSSAWIRNYGYNHEDISNLANCIKNKDLIFNTIPQKLMNSEVLQEVEPDALIIDLASRPGGVDFDAANALDVHIIHALGLPGRVAPLTSASIVFETISNIINENEEVKKQ